MSVTDTIEKNTVDFDLDVVTRDGLLLLDLEDLLLERVPVGDHLVERHLEVEASLHHVTIATIALDNELVPLRHHNEGIPDLRHY